MGRSTVTGLPLRKRANDEPGSSRARVALARCEKVAPVGVRRGICLCFFRCPTRRSCVWVLVFCLPLSRMRAPHPSCPPYAQAELARLKTSPRMGRSLVAQRALAPIFVITRKFVRTSSCGRTNRGPQRVLLLDPLGWGEGSAFAFSGAPHAVLACGSSFSVSRSPACGCPILRVLCEGWVGLCSSGRPPHFAGPWGFSCALRLDPKP